MNAILISNFITAIVSGVFVWCVFPRMIIRKSDMKPMESEFGYEKYLIRLSQQKSKSKIISQQTK